MTAPPSRWRRSAASRSSPAPSSTPRRSRDGSTGAGRELRSEIERAEGKLANERFVSKAPGDVVEAEREKLERYRAELAELG